ncbi:MAG: hypothetical protein RL670_591 [Actinomycetota bacterium]
MTEVIGYLVGILFIALGIGASIAIHEFGHLFPAKKFGVKVTKYMIGFGPTLFSRKRGETEYGIKAIPLGGYIAMIGMYPPAKAGRQDTGRWAETISAARTAHLENLQPGDEKRMFYQLPIYKRIIVMLGGPLMNLFFGTVLLAIALMGIGVVQPTAKLDGITQCFVAGQPSLECTDSATDSPAKLAGLKAGDVIRAINGKPVGAWKDAQLILQGLGDAPIKLGVERDGKTFETTLQPIMTQRNAYDPVTGNLRTDANGQPILVPTPTLGIVLGSARTSASASTVISAAGQSIAQVGQMVISLPIQLVRVGESLTGQASRDPNGPVSLLGVGSIAGQVGAASEVTWQDKLASGLLMLASLNYALFVFNLIPLLPLDGGHVAGGIYEAIKRGIFRVLRKPDPGPADTARLMPLTYLVWIALMASSLLLIVADVVNPIKFF